MRTTAPWKVHKPTRSAWNDTTEDRTILSGVFENLHSIIGIDSNNGLPQTDEFDIIFSLFIHGIHVFDTTLRKNSQRDQEPAARKIYFSPVPHTRIS